jgi:hypothetical protein
MPGYLRPVTNVTNSPPPLCIREKTDLCLVPLDNQAESVLRPAIKDYLGLNSRRWLLQPKLSFPQRYPTYQGWIEVSAVGFNSDKTIAIVYLGYHCGEQCEGGEFKALEKKEGRWQLFTG